MNKPAPVPKMTAEAVQAALRADIDPEKAAFFPRFFKAGPGEYAEGDKFLGVTVPRQRMIARQFRNLPLQEVERLIASEWHEDRFTGLFILVGQYARAESRAIYELYMAHTTSVSNWDLVDSSAPYIVGPWLASRPEQERMQTLRRLAGSKLVWDRRIAMLATYHFIRQGRADEALEVAGLLLHDKHDLIRKAVGWMLRELGKRVDRQLLVAFLDEHAATMPRTALRYAIEHFAEPERRRYLAKR